MRQQGPGIGPMLLTARSFVEYRAMFALSEGDLRGRVLDCPGGAASFVAEAGGRGSDAVAADPVYAGNRATLGDHALGEIERGLAFVEAHAWRFVWSWYGDAGKFRRMRTAAARRFAADLAARPQRYVTAALPALPFPDGTFDLVLSSHLLFSYGDRFDEQFHLAALLELARVARQQVRVFPLLQHTDGEPYPGLDTLRAQLAVRGVGSTLHRVDYEFQLGGNQALVLEPRPPETLFGSILTC